MATARGHVPLAATRRDLSNEFCTPPCARSSRAAHFHRQFIATDSPEIGGVR